MPRNTQGTRTADCISELTRLMLLDSDISTDAQRCYQEVQQHEHTRGFSRKNPDEGYLRIKQQLDKLDALAERTREKRWAFEDGVKCAVGEAAYERMCEASLAEFNRIQAERDATLRGSGMTTTQGSTTR